MKKRKIALLLIMILCLCIIMPAYASDGTSANLIGTNEALGSPLLDNNFQVDDWDQWELITFGVFLSNFAHPFRDDYESTFSTSCTRADSSKGAGFKALQFGSGSDSSNNKVLVELLKYAINTQKNLDLLKPLQVRYNTRIIDKFTEGTEKRAATVKDLFLWTTSDGISLYNDELIAAEFGGSEGSGLLSTIGGWFKGQIALAAEGHPGTFDLNKLSCGYIDVDPIINYNSRAISANQTQIIGAQAALLPEFFIESANEKPIDLLNYDDGWDIQMMTAWLADTFGGSDAISDNTFKDFLSASLYVDAFGNIVALKDSIPYMVFPAAANQHITATPSYNMLQSVLFNGQYIESGDAELIKEGKLSKDFDNTNARGFSAISGGNLAKGKNVILYDSDSVLYNQTIKALETAGIKIKSDATYTVPSTVNLNFGNVITRLFDADINKSTVSEGFRIETVKADDLSDIKRVKSMGRACNVLSVIDPINPNVSKLDYVEVKGQKQNLFGSAVMLSVNETNNAMKNYPNYLYEVSQSNNVTAKESSVNNNFRQANNTVTIEWPALKASIGKAKTEEEVTNVAVNGTQNAGANINSIFRDFLIQSNALVNVRDKDTLNCTLEKLKDNGCKLKDGGSIDKQANKTFSRLVKVYTCSNVMKSASNILGVREGTDFALWCPYIYATYLDWYGIIGDGTPKFNTEIFDTKSQAFTFDIKEATKGLSISDDEKKKDILNYTYMLLDPEAGKEYRANMIMDSFSNWVYKTYQNIVYGRTVDFYSSNNLGNRYGGGFLKIDSYSENFMTGWFINKYAEYIVIIIAILSILVVLIGVITRKKLIWFFVSMLLMINIAILTPVLGEITPYIANNVVENMFNDKMSFWAVSEGVSNATIEKQVSNDTESASNAVDSANLSATDRQQVLGIVKTLNIAYLDRAIMIKLDISKKITDTQLYSYDEIQKLQSARWLLPIMLRQFTASNGSADYVYVPIADEFDNLSNMYWKNKPSDMANVQTSNAVNNSVTSNSTTNQTDTYKNNIAKTSLYLGYKDTQEISSTLKNEVRIGTNYKDNLDKTNWKSNSRSDEKNDKCVHTFFYLIDKIPNSYALSIPANNEDSWNKYVKNSLNNVSGLKDNIINAENVMETYAGTYNYQELPTVQREYYGFLWNTENPLHYMYEVVKDTFASDVQLSQLAGDLQGTITKNPNTDEQIRESFMHYYDTGKIKDFLDMEELFTNVMPYMYSVQVLAGGTDGRSGALGTQKMDIYTTYKNNYKSWMYRSNWVTKLMESRELTRPETVKMPNGTSIRVENPMEPSSYLKASNGKRPMIFSEAEMYALGMNESNLTVPELKILKVNKAVERRWTLMLNYVNVKGMTKEVMFRQMALEALIQFDKEFTTGSTLNASLAMYPNGLDLRNISFDSVMKMLMLNTTKDVRYVYGDTMLRMIEDNDLFSAILMLLGAFLSSYVIPFIRDVLLGLLFYLGIWSIICSIVAGAKAKLKITTAFVINNVVFLIMTIAYYLSFSLMVNITYTDDVLTVSNITVNVGNPVWVFIIIVLVSAAYLWGCFKLIAFAIKNYRDMGFEVYATFAGMLANKISDGVGNVGNKITDAMKGDGSSDESTGASLGGNKKSINNTNETYNENNTNQEFTVNNVENDNNWGEDESRENVGESGYVSNYSTEKSSEETSEKIDAEIEKGKKM